MSGANSRTARLEIGFARRATSLVPPRSSVNMNSWRWRRSPVAGIGPPVAVNANRVGRSNRVTTRSEGQSRPPWCPTAWYRVPTCDGRRVEHLGGHRVLGPLAVPPNVGHVVERYFGRHRYPRGDGVDEVAADDPPFREFDLCGHRSTFAVPWGSVAEKSATEPITSSSTRSNDARSMSRSPSSSRRGCRRLHGG